MVAHAALTGAELHEPKGVAAATVGTVYVANGAGSGAWGQISYKTVPNGFPVGFAYSQTQVATTQTSQIPMDNTIPQNTEGTQVLSLAYTPQSATNLLKIDVAVACSEDANSGNYMIAALFQDSTANALVSGTSNMPASSSNDVIYFSYVVVAGSTSSRTYKVRAGLDVNAAWSLNKSNGVTLGGTPISSISITEIKAS